MRATIAWAKKLRPYRVYKDYSDAGGNLLAAGMSFQALFATFAAIWIGFSLTGIFLNERPELRAAIIVFINTLIPDLIKPGGPIDPTILEHSVSFGWTGGLAIVVVFYTAINWLNYARTAVRTIFDLPPSNLNFVLLKLYDLVLALIYGLFIVLSAGATVVATRMASTILPLLSVKDNSGWGKFWFEVVALLIVFIFDVAVLAAVIRVLSGVPIPFKNLRTGVLLGGLSLTALKILGSYILTRTEANPLLASFAVFIGLLVYFNFASRIYLLATSWVAVSMSDDKVEVQDIGWVVPHHHTKD